MKLHKNKSLLSGNDIANTIVLICFTLIWLMSLFLIALGAQDTVEINYGIDFIHPYLDQVYNMIPANTIVGIGVMSLLMISRHLFKL